jgi:AbrB family looped-hinge helix DNA binding protein
MADFQNPTDQAPEPASTPEMSLADIPAFVQAMKDDKRIKPKWVEVAANGRVVIPAAMRDALGMAGGDKLLARLDGEGRLVLETADVVFDRIQAAAAPFIVPGVSIVDELIAERHAEAERE